MEPLQKAEESKDEGLQERITFLENKNATLTKEKREVEVERDEMVDSYNFRKEQFESFAAAKLRYIASIQEKEKINCQLSLDLENCDKEIACLKIKVAEYLETIQVLAFRLEEEKNRKIVESFCRCSTICNSKRKKGIGRKAISLEILGKAVEESDRAKSSFLNYQMKKAVIAFSPTQGQGPSKERDCKDEVLAGALPRQSTQRTPLRQCHIL